MLNLLGLLTLMIYHQVSELLILNPSVLLETFRRASYSIKAEWFLTMETYTMEKLTWDSFLVMVFIIVLIKTLLWLFKQRIITKLKSFNNNQDTFS
jgi:hypothetical protein